MTASDDKTKLWLAETPLILASGSRTRLDLLRSAGLDPEVVPASIDERAIEAASSHRSDQAELARHLAELKALAVSRAAPHRLVLGADQTLAVGGGQLHKTESRAEAEATLRTLSGRAHTLHSGLALARSGAILWSHVETARLHVRVLSPAFIAAYLVLVGPAAYQSVGAYQYEGLGVHLFERIEGDQSTILGLPLPPLLAELRRMGLLLT